VWNSETNIKGPPGPAGPAGAASTVPGPQGPPGTTGPAGPTGPAGADGATIPPATAIPLVESGAGAVGTATKYAREDHVHPAAGGGSVKEVSEYANLAAFPATGAVEQIYVAKDTNKIYRWAVPPPVSTEVSQWLARAPGLDAAHIAADTALIDGLVAAGLWTKFDFLHLYATQDSTTAKLNLISSNFTAVTNGSPVFTANRGFTGVAGSSTVYIDTQFNPTTAPSPKYTINDAHQSVWSLSNITASSAPFGASGSGRANYIMIRYTDNNAYLRVNLGDVGGADGSNPGSALGWFVGSRTGDHTVNPYLNGAAFGTPISTISGTPPNLNLYSLGMNNNGVPLGTAHQLAMDSAGSKLTSGEVATAYTLLRARMTAVGVP
jgi:hypothetical protein